MERELRIARKKVTKAEAGLETARGEIRIKGREIETLKAENGSLHGVTMDSTKLLTEKLALTRQISNLRPEVDHLRSQAAQNQSLLAQKLALEHQLGTLQVILETEKKSTQRLLARDQKSNHEDAKHEDELRALRADLQHERLEKQKVERDAQQASHAWEARRLNLESRLESFQDRLKSTRDSLKAARQELLHARPIAMTSNNDRASSIPGRSLASISRKRTATQMLSDSTIGTPGDIINSKRPQRPTALPGDKSTFSITPYLNRTASATFESPPGTAIPSVDPIESDDISGSVDPSVNPALTAHSAIATKTSSDKNTEAPDARKGGRKNVEANAGPKNPKIAPSLERVAEEEILATNTIVKSLGQLAGQVDDHSKRLETAEGRKKKRRLLGGGLNATLLDDDGNDDDHDQLSSKTGVGLKAARSLGTGGLQGRQTVVDLVREPPDCDLLYFDVSKGLCTRVLVSGNIRLFQRGAVCTPLINLAKVAVDRTAPAGHVLGIDVIPAKPPAGVSTMQGNFLSLAVQDEVKKFLKGIKKGTARPRASLSYPNHELEEPGISDVGVQTYLEQEKQSGVLAPESAYDIPLDQTSADSANGLTTDLLVDVILSDMSAPWDLIEGYRKRSLSNPYYRMVNTSGNNFRDHAGSMDLCYAALKFGFDTLRPSGHFICKFYQGSEDKAFEACLKLLFSRVHREKPESSRTVCLSAHTAAILTTFRNPRKHTS
ncbi:MAG: hypothetical protein Q9220_000680 [cf. Caloplaca sp. 1 TL-2023]